MTQLDWHRLTKNNIVHFRRLTTPPLINKALDRDHYLLLCGHVDFIELVSVRQRNQDLDAYKSTAEATQSNVL